MALLAVLPFLLVLPAAVPSATHPLEVVRLESVATISLRGAGIPERSLGDFDLLADGRVAVLDFDARRAAVLWPDGTVARVLSPVEGIPRIDALISSLVGLADGRLILADGNGGRFFVYDEKLELRTVIPFGIEIHSLSGLVEHPAGDLYVTGYSPDTDRILHRFDAGGRYVASYVDALPASHLRKPMDSAVLAVDPEDGTLWLSRLSRYEIRHLSPAGVLLDRFGRDVPGFDLPRGKRVGDHIRFAPGAMSTRIAVAGGYVINSFRRRNGVQRADVFRKDGTVVALDLTPDSTVALAKQTRGGGLLRLRDGSLEVWVERR